MEYNNFLYLPYDNIDNLCPIIVDSEKVYVYTIEDNELSNEYDIVFFNNYFKVKGKEINNYDLTDCYEYVTNDYWYKLDLYKTFVMFDTIFLFGFLIPWYIFTQFFKRILLILKVILR